MTHASGTSGKVANAESACVLDEVVQIHVKHTIIGCFMLQKGTCLGIDQPANGAVAPSSFPLSSTVWISDLEKPFCRTSQVRNLFAFKN
jgi:hypothetical protein